MCCVQIGVHFRPEGNVVMSVDWATDGTAIQIDTSDFEHVCLTLPDLKPGPYDGLDIILLRFRQSCQYYAPVRDLHGAARTFVLIGVHPVL